MKGEAYKIEFTHIWHIKIDITYIRYYLAAKIDFTRKPILAVPDLASLKISARFVFLKSCAINKN